MKKTLLPLLFCLFSLSLTAQNSDIVISELMYNNPGTDSVEYIELYNKGAASIDLSGWSFNRGISFLFPSLSLASDEFIIIAGDSAAFRNVFGQSALQWQSGSLSNNGEAVELVDGLTNFVDSVRYDDLSPWPTAADGLGSSLVLCDYDADNADPNNWQAASTDAGVNVSGTPIFANPGADSDCQTGPVVRFLAGGASASETAGSVTVGLEITNGTVDQTQAGIMINPINTTATENADFTLSTTTAIFVAGMMIDTQYIDILLINDMDQEAIESLELAITSVDNGGNIDPMNNTYNLTILDDDTPLTRDLIISGVYDAHPAASGAKGVEFKAVNDIPDLSIFGFGSANNGNGTDGQEFSFPTTAIDSGTCIYVAADSVLFADFFDFDATYISGASNINGDDAIELFENGIVIDIFGDINVDGGGTAWDYTDGFAYRKNGSGPDGSNFVLGNWIFSGVDALQDVPNNMAAANPFPLCVYSPIPSTVIDAVDDFAGTDINTSINIDVLSNDATPNNLQSIQIASTTANGTAIVNPSDLTVSYSPALDYCGTDIFTYEICDAFACDTARVTVSITCPPSYPIKDIGTLTVDNNGDGLSDFIDSTAEIRGIAYGVDLRGGDGVQFTLIDATDGIAIFDFALNYYSVTEGDDLSIQGTVTQFNGLTQFLPDTIMVNSNGNPLVTPTIVTSIGEEEESQLIRLENVVVVDPSEWNNSGSGFNVRVTNQIDTFIMRIDNDVDIFGTNPIEEPMNVTGIGSQFDSNAPYEEGYQIIPRYLPDLDIINRIPTPIWSADIRIYPNPVQEQLILESKVALDAITVSNLLGQELLHISQASTKETIHLSELERGMYLINIQKGDEWWSMKFIKK